MSQLLWAGVMVCVASHGTISSVPKDQGGDCSRSLATFERVFSGWYIRPHGLVRFTNLTEIAESETRCHWAQQQALKALRASVMTPLHKFDDHGMVTTHKQYALQHERLLRCLSQNPLKTRVRT